MEENSLSSPKAAESLLLFSYETSIHKNVKALKEKIENEKDLKKTQFLIKLHSNNKSGLCVIIFFINLSI